MMRRGCNTRRVQRYGITIPFDDVPLSDHVPLYRRLVDLGYTDVWTGEAGAADGFTPLAVAAVAAPELQLGTAVVPVYTRGPGLLAMQAATMAELAPGRFALGIGSSSDVIVERWNAGSFDEPYKRVRDTVRFLRRALAGEKVDEEYDTFAVRGFRLGRRIEQPPPVYVAALRPGMLHLAGREADGAIINWLAADDVPQVVREVGAGASGSKEIVARIFVCPTEDAERARFVGRMGIAAYLNVAVYAAFHEWLGRGPQLKGMWDAWRGGDRKAALAAIPDEVVDALVLHGPASHIREQIARYVENGVTIPVLMLLPGGDDLDRSLAGLAPTA
ncbi:MAG TPA: LLM class F420-dependent oxidoreductase [Acidimicrobiales bacterium]|nr:LLM class F420-dependent oxidoreductase [Acidimicrobiales bacterium]